MLFRSNHVVKSKGLMFFGYIIEIINCLIMNPSFIWRSIGLEQMTINPFKILTVEIKCLNCIQDFNKPFFFNILTIYSLYSYMDNTAFVFWNLINGFG